MADKKITQLTQHTSVINSDLLPVVDIIATETKKLAVGTLRDFINQGLISSSAQLDLSNFAIISGGNSLEGNQQVDGWIEATDYISTDNVLYTNAIEENITNGGLSFVAGGSGFTFNNNVEVTGSVIANSFTGSLLGTASISNQLLVSQSVTNTNFKLLFATTGNGYKDVLQDSGTDGTYNPWTNTLTATNLAGTATNATNVNIATNSTNTNYYVSFAYGSGNNRVTIDGGGQFTYNPSTNTLTVPTVVGNLTGTATTASYVANATSASYALTASYAENAGVTVDTGSLLVTASVALNVITFTKGDASTFNVTVDTGSAVTVNTGSLLTTASFSGDQITFTKGDGSTFAGVITSVTSSISASYALTASYVETAQTASYVLNAVSASFSTTASYVPSGVPTGGTTGQILIKSSGTDYDTAWSDPANLPFIAYAKDSDQDFPTAADVTFPTASILSAGDSFGSMAATGVFTFSSIGNYLITVSYNTSASGSSNYADLDIWGKVNDSNSPRYLQLATNASKKGSVSEVIPITNVNDNFRWYSNNTGGPITIYGTGDTKTKISIVKLN